MGFVRCFAKTITTLPAIRKAMADACLAE